MRYWINGFSYHAEAPSTAAFFPFPGTPCNFHAGYLAHVEEGLGYSIGFDSAALFPKLL
jgi:hypothetical protein